VCVSINDHGPDTHLRFETIASQQACRSFRETVDENSPDTRLSVSLGQWACHLRWSPSGRQCRRQCRGVVLFDFPI